MAEIYISENQLNKAQKYTEIALDFYTEKYGEISESALLAQQSFLKIQFAKTKSAEVVDLAISLSKNVDLYEDEKMKNYYDDLSSQSDRVLIEVNSAESTE